MEPKKSGTEGSKNGTRKVGKNRCLPSQKKVKLQVRDEQILIALHYNSVLKIAQKNVERSFGISKSAFYRRIKKLEAYGVIHKIPDTLILEYLIDPEFRKTQSHFLSLSGTDSAIFESPSKFSPFDEKIIRSHNYLFLCPIEHKPAKLDKMLKRDNWLENTRMTNWPYFYGHLGLEGIKAYIQFNPKTINIRVLKVYGKNSHENDQEANRQFLEVKAHLENKYRHLRIGPGKFLTKAINTGKHHGWVHHILALKAKQQNLTLQKQYWGLDSSKGKPELDAHDRLKASEHIDRELEDFDYRAENEVYFQDIDQRQESIINRLQEIQQIQTQLLGGVMSSFQIAEAALNSTLEFRHGKKSTFLAELKRIGKKFWRRVQKT